MSWPHAPVHIFNHIGTYIVTGATYEKQLFFKADQELDLLQNLLFELADKYKWRLEAWAIFSNHYHFIAQSPEDPASLRKLMKHFHGAAAKNLNDLHKTPGRKVMHQYWDTRITHQNSYLARLNYVMQNPVRHKLVDEASQYKWCSVNWFKNNANPSYRKTVLNFKVDEVNVIDDF